MQNRQILTAQCIPVARPTWCIIARLWTMRTPVVVSMAGTVQKANRVVTRNIYGESMGNQKTKQKGKKKINFCNCELQILISARFCRKYQLLTRSYKCCSEEGSRFTVPCPKVYNFDSVPARLCESQVSLVKAVSVYGISAYSNIKRIPSPRPLRKGTRKNKQNTVCAQNKQLG